MNFPAFASTLFIGAVTLACYPANQAEQVITNPQSDTLLIDEQLLSRSPRIDPVQNLVSAEDVIQLTGGDAILYRADTLATTDAAHVVLLGRLYAEETVGWLVTVGLTNQQLIDKQVVYYDNAEGMSETQAKWLPRQGRVLVETGTYDEADNYQVSRVMYTVTSDGTFSKAN